MTLLPRRGYVASYVPEHGVIGFAFDLQTGTHAIGSDAVRPFRAVPYTLSWVPPGCDVYSESERGGEYLMVTPRRDAAAPSFPAERVVERRDVVARAVACRLRRRLLAGHGNDDAAVAADIERLYECIASPLAESPERASMASWFTGSRLRRIEQCIDSRLGEPLDVADLAASCGVSSSFLTRVMKASLGRSPYDYLIERRVAHARERLVHGHEAIADIAFTCGFSSHSHLSATLRQRLGVTPSRLREGSVRVS